MRGTLNSAIDAANDDSASLPSLLRKMMTVGHDLGSEKLKDWARQELHGYGAAPTELPHYRSDVPVGVTLYFVSTFGPPQTKPLRVSESDFPVSQEFRDALFKEQLTQPVGEIAHWADGKSPSSNVPSPLINQMRKWGEEGRAPRMEWAALNEGRRELSQSNLHSVLDSIRTTALELCLEIDSELAEETEGAPDQSPIDVVPELQSRVDSLTIQYVYPGATGQIMQAENIDVTVHEGDLQGLLEVIRKLGFGDDAVTELEEAIENDGRRWGERVTDWTQNVKRGVFKVAGDASSQVVAAQALQALQGFMGGVGG